MISHASGNVDFSWGTSDDVNLHKLLPERADPIITITSPRGIVQDELVVKGGIALRIECKFE